MCDLERRRGNEREGGAIAEKGWRERRGTLGWSNGLGLRNIDILNSILDSYRYSKPFHNWLLAT